MCSPYSITQGPRTCSNLSYCFARLVEFPSPLPLLLTVALPRLLRGLFPVPQTYTPRTSSSKVGILGLQPLGPVSRSQIPMDFIFQLILLALIQFLFVPGTWESPFSDSPFKMCLTGGERALKTRVLFFLSFFRVIF